MIAAVLATTLRQVEPYLRAAGFEDAAWFAYEMAEALARGDAQYLSLFPSHLWSDARLMIRLSRRPGAKELRVSVDHARALLWIRALLLAGMRLMEAT